MKNKTNAFAYATVPGLKTRFATLLIHPTVHTWFSGNPYKVITIRLLTVYTALKFVLLSSACFKQGGFGF